jgi:hypothetical protein
MGKAALEELGRERIRGTIEIIVGEELKEALGRSVRRESAPIASIIGTGNARELSSSLGRA